MNINIDDLMEYLIVTDQVDEYFGLKKEEDEEEKEDQNEEDNTYGRRR